MKLICHSEVPRGYYSKLAADFHQKNPELYKIYPVSEDNLTDIQQQLSSFTVEKRELLANTLHEQYRGIEIHDAVKTNIEKLKQPNTFTVTTGQQLHIFLGPVFFIYKITSVIRQARRLQQEHPENNYVPVFWMASEDHDLDEINEVSVFGKKYTWQAEKGEPVGRLSTLGLENLCNEWLAMAEKESLPDDLSAVFYAFKTAYSKCSSLSDATRFIINYLFEQYGLIVIDTDSKELKSALTEVAINDIESEGIFNALHISSAELKKLGYGNQVNPRRTHFFMIKNGLRQRIDRVEGGFNLHPSNEYVSEESMHQLIINSPEVFSPNALLRPIFQQQILPNVAYVCGPSELHYWHQLYPVFQREHIAAPILLLRDSYILLDAKTQQFLNVSGIDYEFIWLGYEAAAKELENVLLGKQNLNKDITILINHTEKIFESLHNLKYKNIKELREINSAWIKELNKANKLLSSDLRSQPAYEPLFNKLRKLTNADFNTAAPQERVVSWIEFILKYKINPIKILIENTNRAMVFGSLSV
jgi:bacillithiol biosynthesis cysteine-adding enzyme BshC